MQVQWSKCYEADIQRLVPALSLHCCGWIYSKELDLPLTSLPFLRGRHCNNINVQSNLLLLCSGLLTYSCLRAFTCLQMEFRFFRYTVYSVFWRTFYSQQLSVVNVFAANGCAIVFCILRHKQNYHNQTSIMHS